MIKKLSNKKLAHYMRNNSNVSKHKSRSIRVARTRKNVSRRTRKFLHRGGEQSPVKVVEPVKVPGETVKVASKPFEEERSARNAGPKSTFAPLSSAGPLKPPPGPGLDNGVFGFPSHNTSEVPLAPSNAMQAKNVFDFPGQKEEMFGFPDENAGMYVSPPNSTTGAEGKQVYSSTNTSIIVPSTSDNVYGFLSTNTSSDPTQLIPKASALGDESTVVRLPDAGQRDASSSTNRTNYAQPNIPGNSGTNQNNNVGYMNAPFLTNNNVVNKDGSQNQGHTENSRNSSLPGPGPGNVYGIPLNNTSAGHAFDFTSKQKYLNENPENLYMPMSHIHLPNTYETIIHTKKSSTAFKKMVKQDNKKKRKKLLKQIANSMKTDVKALSRNKQIEYHKAQLMSEYTVKSNRKKLQNKTEQNIIDNAKLNNDIEARERIITSNIIGTNRRKQALQKLKLQSANHHNKPIVNASTFGYIPYDNKMLQAALAARYGAPQ